MKTTGIYISRGDDTLGPYDELESAERMKRGDLLPNDFAARIGDAAWVPLSVLLAQEIPPTPTSEIRAVAVPVPVSEPRPVKVSPNPKARAAKHEPAPVVCSAVPVPEVRPTISTLSLEGPPSTATPVAEVRTAKSGPGSEIRSATVAPAARARPAPSAVASTVGPAALAAALKIQSAIPASPSENQRVAPGQNFSWSRSRILVIFLVALLAGGSLLAVRWLTQKSAYHPVVQAKPSPTGSIPPRPLVKTTPAPVAPRPKSSPMVETTPTPKIEISTPIAGVSPAPSVAGPALTTPGNSSPSAAVVLTTPIPGVVAPVPSAPEEKGFLLHGVVSLGAPHTATVKLAGVRVMAYPLAVLTPALAARQAQVEADLARLAPQIAAAEAERTTRAADERAAQQALFNAPPNRLRSSLRFAYEQAKVAVKAAEADYQYLLDQRREQMDGESYFRDLPPAVATTETDAVGKFSLELPPGKSFAVAASARRMTAEGPHVDYWLVKIPASEEGRKTFALSSGNVASSGSADSLIRTAE